MKPNLLRAMLVTDIVTRVPTAPREVLIEIVSLLDGTPPPKPTIGAKLHRAETIIARTLKRRTDRSNAQKHFEDMTADLAAIEPALRSFVFTAGDAASVAGYRSARSVLAFLRLRSGAFGSKQRLARPTRADIDHDVNLIAKLVTYARAKGT